MNEPTERDGIVAIESRTMAGFDADKFHIAVTLVSIGPEDIHWFNQHCDGNWREHLSGRKVEATGHISGLELVLQTDPIFAIQHMRRALAHKLAEEIVGQCEPIMSRYVHGMEVPL